MLSVYTRRLSFQYVADMRTGDTAALPVYSFSEAAANGCATDGITSFSWRCYIHT